MNTSLIIEAFNIFLFFNLLLFNVSFFYLSRILYARCFSKNQLFLHAQHNHTNM